MARAHRLQRARASEVEADGLDDVLHGATEQLLAACRAYLAQLPTCVIAIAQRR